MLVNYRSYYRLIFTTVTTFVEKKIGSQKESNFFLLDKSFKFRNYYKVNMKKQQNTVLIHIFNVIGLLY